MKSKGPVLYNAKRAMQPLVLIPNTNQELRDVIEEDGGIKSDPA